MIVLIFDQYTFMAIVLYNGNCLYFTLQVKASLGKCIVL